MHHFYLINLIGAQLQIYMIIYVLHIYEKISHCKRLLENTDITFILVLKTIVLLKTTKIYSHLLFSLHHLRRIAPI